MRATVKAAVVTCHVRNPACTTTSGRLINGLSARDAHAYGTKQIHLLNKFILVQTTVVSSLAFIWVNMGHFSSIWMMNTDLADVFSSVAKNILRLCMKS